MRIPPGSALLACLATTLALGAPPAPKEKPALVYIRAGRLLDGVSDVARERMAILVEGERITAVKPEAELPRPPGASLVDLSQATVLPGLIDCHVHLASRGDQFDPILAFRTTPHHAAIAAVKNAATTLAAGFTTVRDVGGPAFLAVDLKGAIAEGFVPGPRIVASGLRESEVLPSGVTLRFHVAVAMLPDTARDPATALRWLMGMVAEMADDHRKSIRLANF